MDQFISKEVLDILSYHSTLGRSLKQISLRKTPLPIILDDIEKYRASYMIQYFKKILLDLVLKVKILLKGSMKRLLKQVEGLNNVLMTY